VRIEWWWRNLREGNHLEDIAVYGSIILKWTFKKTGTLTRLMWFSWWATVNVGMNPRVPQNTGKFLSI
jgi:hypothetical protein